MHDKYRCFRAQRSHNKKIWLGLPAVGFAPVLRSAADWSMEKTDGILKGRDTILIAEVCN